mgnify:CR=1 FL=1
MRHLVRGIVAIALIGLMGCSAKQDIIMKGALSSIDAPAGKDRRDITAQSIDYLLYEYVQCEVDWRHHCEASYKLEAPAGWQACKRLYTIQGELGNRKFSFTPTDWYTGDSENPDRFRSFTLYMFVQGSTNPIDRWGSNLKLGNVGLKIIPAESTNKDRFDLGCEMPAINS